MIYSLYFDGSCEPNPGGKAIGSFILKGENGNYDQDAELCCEGEGATNNVAEWHGLLLGLRAYRSRPFFKFADTLLIFGDSGLVIKQLMGLEKCKAEHLKPMRKEAVKLLEPLTWALRWIPRELNKEADRLGRLLISQGKQPAA